MIDKPIINKLCNRDCQVKVYLSNNTDWMLYLTLCNNCIHSRKLDHYLSRKEWDKAEKDFENESLWNKIINKIIKFLESGQG